MVVKQSNTSYGAVSSTPRRNLEDATSMERWTTFLQVYESFITEELAQQHPQFAQSLCQLELDTRIDHERQSAQVLATLELKDAKILALQKEVNEQREQLDVVLDELERREIKEDKGVQVTTEWREEEIKSVHRARKDVCSQTEQTKGESEGVKRLKKLEKELKTLEEKNSALEKESHQRASQKTEKIEDNEIFTKCVEIVQSGVDAMNLSSGCVASPLTLFAGMPEIGVGKATCENLEHRFEAQNVRLEHIQECLYLWRDAVVQFMKRADSSHAGTERVKSPTLRPVGARQDEHDCCPATECITALRGALAQIQQHILPQNMQYNEAEQEYVVKEFAAALASGKNGLKNAAKIVQKWAKWEAKHLREVRALKQGFSEERAVEHSRRLALVRRIDHLKQQGVGLQTEVNTWKKMSEVYRSRTEPNVSLSPFQKPKTNLGGNSLEYPQLLARLAFAEQSLLVKDEQLAVASTTIKALSSCTSSSTAFNSFNSFSDSAINSLSQLAGDLHRVLKPKLDLLQQRQTGLVSVSQFFQAKKESFKHESRLEVETKKVAILKAANQECEHEREELLRKVEKLETEALMATIKYSASVPLMDTHGLAEKSTEQKTDESCALVVALKRLQLVEDDRKSMRKTVCELQQQIASMQQQRQDGGPIKDSGKQTTATSVVNFVAEHHQKCIAQFQDFLTRQSESQQLLSSHNEYEPMKQAHLECEVFLTHYETLWIAFSFLYSFITHSSQTLETMENDSFNCELNLVESCSKIDNLEFEIDKRNEENLLLQQRLLAQDSKSEAFNQSFRRDTKPDSPRNPPHASKAGSANVIPQNLQGIVEESEAGQPFLALTKPQKARFEPESMALKALPPTYEQYSAATSLMESHKAIADELDKCLAKCSDLMTQNARLKKQLQAEKEMNKLQNESHTKTNLIVEKKYSCNLKDTAQVKDIQNMDLVAGCKTDRLQQEYEALKEQLTSREAENLALKQSLCTIKERCEVDYENQLRVKAADHAERMESYMSTVNETLSRIETDKRCIEKENGKMRIKLQQLEEKRAQKQQHESLQCTTGTNTEDSLGLAVFAEEKAALNARVEDLQLQLSRERKLVQMLEQKKLCGDQDENNGNTGSLTTQDEFKLRCEAIEKWRDKLQDEFKEYQSVQRACAHESTKRIEFLSACIDGYIHLMEENASRGETTITANELYSVIMELARDRKTNKEFTKEPYDPIANPSEKFNVQALQNGSSSDSQSKPHDKSSDLEVSEALWWKLRASKLEAYVRSAMLQNDTFEDTMRQLEGSLSDVKQELSSRLTHESQLMSQLAILTSELATVKDEAASIAEQYQAVRGELEKQREEASRRLDETQRARLTIQRKTELVTQQKVKVISLQQELDRMSKKVERLVVAEKQTASLQQKAKDSTHQLVHARQNNERCHTDNVRLSMHLERLNERNARVLARFKAVRAENAHLREQCAKSARNKVKSDGKRDNKSCTNQVDENTELRALKRRVLQKQDVIVSYKAKVTEFEAQLARQRDTMMKLARTTRELQQGQRQQEDGEHEKLIATYRKHESQYEIKQEQLDGLRASIYDSFEAYVAKQSEKSAFSSSGSIERSFLEEREDEDEDLAALKRWTDFSIGDLEELKLNHRPRYEEATKSNQIQGELFQVALQKLENALEANPEECRAEICQLLQYLCN